MDLPLGSTLREREREIPIYNCVLECTFVFLTFSTGQTVALESRRLEIARPLQSLRRAVGYTMCIAVT
jgi:hypothetical protein